MSAESPLHLTDNDLLAHARGQTIDGTSEHLHRCQTCRDRQTMLAASTVDEANPQHGAEEPMIDTIPPELLGLTQYVNIRVLGRGGMGVVYRATNRLMGRDEVLKVADRARIDRPELAERFLREIQAAAKLLHPNVVAAYAALEAGNLLIFAMEYISGEDLNTLVQVKGPLPVATACYYAFQAALGLQHAHERGMVHRDIKPANLMRAHEGQRRIIKILDFGLAKGAYHSDAKAAKLGEGKVLGTPLYLSPNKPTMPQKPTLGPIFIHLAARSTSCSCEFPEPLLLNLNCHLCNNHAVSGPGLSLQAFC